MNENQLDQISDNFMKRPRYYEDLGQAHDDLMRCKDCQSLVTYSTIVKLGMCPGDGIKACGNKRFSEITMLSEQEMDDIKSGKIDFQYRDKFLAEFNAVANS